MEFQEFSAAMCFSYGAVVYTRDRQAYQGEAILTPHKFYLKNQQGEIQATFVPLEKVFKVKLGWGRLTLFVQPSNFLKFEAQVKGRPKMILSLLRDLAAHRNFQKRLFGLEWHDPDFFKVL